MTEQNIERPSADAADPILSLSETLGGVSGALWRSLGEPGGSLGAPYTLYMDVIYIECYVNGLFAHMHWICTSIYSKIILNGVSCDHIQCIWTPFTVNSL